MHSKEIKTPSILVSVVMLTYNHEKYIEQALESVLKQDTSFEYEIIIGDDASNDNTGKIVSHYAQLYPEKIIAIIRAENIGATRNLTDLLKRCRGKYIASCEGDDYWTDTNKLARQVQFLENNREYIACSHDVELVNEKGELLPQQELTWISKQRNYTFVDFKGIFLPGHPVSLVHRNIFKDEISPEIICETHELIADRTLALMLVLRGDIYRLEGIMAAYRKHDINTGENVTTKLYKGIDSCLTDFSLNLKLENYASRVRNKKTVFRSFRWKIILRATAKVLLLPTLENWKTLKMLYQQYLNNFIFKD